ncbi:hypothetical protein NDU88_007350 [Pleurodeles waltl]|uniref:Uncharacterized protein n=1 Tax=Pleurodeles waltl TaxID=8319 RepID=A0AAV7RRK6_PLEWA|nr:hypothetical protein NDU88_007350 [Pleurodeles waltl]
MIVVERYDIDHNELRLIFSSIEFQVQSHTISKLIGGDGLECSALVKGRLRTAVARFCGDLLRLLLGVLHAALVALNYIIWETGLDTCAGGETEQRKAGSVLRSSLVEVSWRFGAAEYPVSLARGLTGALGLPLPRAVRITVLLVVPVECPVAGSGLA